MKIPILLIIFNRPEYVEEMLCALKEIKAEKIYISADGARKNIKGEFEKCELTRKKFLEGITWPCTIRTNFEEGNLGCKKGVIKAIDWFFEHEKYGNILEDDCIPNKCFFKFTEMLLKRYEKEERVWMISGDNSADIELMNKNTYSFVREPIIWGWATWKSTWEKYDMDMKQWRRIRNSFKAKKIFINRSQYKQLSADYDKCMNEEIDTWDYQLSAVMKINNGLCIIPKANLIKNIGFDKDATHTSEITERSNKRTEEIGEIVFTQKIEIDKGAERQIMNRIQGINSKGIIERYLEKLIRQISKAKRRY